jgi:hypothetical protein
MCADSITAGEGAHEAGQKTRTEPANRGQNRPLGAG